MQSGSEDIIVILPKQYRSVFINPDMIDLSNFEESNLRPTIFGVTDILSSRRKITNNPETGPDRLKS